MGFQKNESEKNSVDHFCGKHAMGAKNGNVVFFLWVGVFFGGYLRK